MSDQKFLIKISNVKTNTDTIVQKTTTLNTCVKDFETIYNHLKLKITDVQTTLVQGEIPSMIIYINQQKINKGYLYNTSSQEQDILYKITLISIDTELTNLFPNNVSLCYTVQKRKPIRSSCFKGSSREKLQRSFKQHVYSVYPVNASEWGCDLKLPTIPEHPSYPSHFEYQPLLSNSNSNSDSESNSESNASLSSPKFNPLEFNQEFVDELKQKLNKLNFGLKNKIE